MKIRKIVPMYSETATTYNVIAYVYGTPSTMDVAKLTHVNYAFGNIVDGEVSVSNGQDLSKLVSFKSSNPKILVLKSISMRITSFGIIVCSIKLNIHENKKRRT